MSFLQEKQKSSLLYGFSAEAHAPSSSPGLAQIGSPSAAAAASCGGSSFSLGGSGGMAKVPMSMWLQHHQHHMTWLRTPQNLQV